jgi:hypothetical protein
MATVFAPLANCTVSTRLPGVAVAAATAIAAPAISNVPAYRNAAKPHTCLLLLIPDFPKNASVFASFE